MVLICAILTFVCDNLEIYLNPMGEADKPAPTFNIEAKNAKVIHPDYGYEVTIRLLVFSVSINLVLILKSL